VSEKKLSQLRTTLEQTLFDVESTERLFNMYTSVNPDYDVHEAAAIRRANLLAYLSACSQTPELLLLAEAPGPNGCRFSGIPFTAEEQLLSDTFPVVGRQSSNQAMPRSEYSSRIVWDLLAPHFERVVIWNAVPLHPHKPGHPMSIRTPSVSEIRTWAPLIRTLTDHFRPTQVISIGRIAERACSIEGITSRYVRHPSQGGANIFRDQIRAALGTS